MNSKIPDAVWIYQQSYSTRWWSISIFSIGASTRRKFNKFQFRNELRIWNSQFKVSRGFNKLVFLRVGFNRNIWSRLISCSRLMNEDWFYRCKAGFVGSALPMNQPTSQGDASIIFISRSITRKSFANKVLPSEKYIFHVSQYMKIYIINHIFLFKAIAQKRISFKFSRYTAFTKHWQSL